MKTSSLFSAVIACALLVTPTPASTDITAGWSAELAAAQQASSQDTGGRLRAEAILRAVLDAARTGLTAHEPSGRSAETPPVDASLDAASAHAAYSVLSVLYPQSRPALDARLAGSLAEVAASAPAIAAGRAWGERVAQAVLADQSDAVFLNPSSFANEVKAPLSPSTVPELRAEQAAISPGRYSFTTLAGAPNAEGHLDGIGAGARFGNLGGIAVDAAGTAYVSEEQQGTIRKITANGEVSTLAGTPGQRGSQDGVGPAARFNQPIGVAVDLAGNVFVADFQNHAVRKIDASGQVTTLAGLAGTPGHVDGAGATTRLDSPIHVAVDDAGNVFVSELGGQRGRIRKIAPDGTVTTLKITVPSYTDVVGTHNYAYFWPWQLGTDHAGNLYVVYSDGWDFSDVVKLTPTGGETYAGTTLRPPIPARWAMGLGLDDADNVYVKYEANPICLFAPNGEVQVRYVSTNSGGAAWADMTVGRFGTLYTLPDDYAPETKGTIKIGLFDSGATGPVILVQPYNYSQRQGDSVNFSVQAAGTAGLTYQWYFDANPISGATGSTLSLQNVQNSQAGFYSVVISDGVSSVTSRSATLAVTGQAPPPPPPPPPHLPPGSGSFDAGIALAVLGLLAVAARRRPQARAARAEASRGP